MLLQDKIFNLFDYKNGFFIEAGAFDGIEQSNTYRLEREKDWKGILIEPSVDNFNLCVKNRNNICINCALVSNDYGLNYLEGDWSKGGLMASFNGERLKREGQINQMSKAPCITLNKILTALKVDKIDFFSLDVEGYELEVLKGLDLNIFKPLNILVETEQIDRVMEHLHMYSCELYSEHNASHKDYLLKLMKIPTLNFLVSIRL